MSSLFPGYESKVFPTVSVVLPIKNEEKYIIDCLNSLVYQDYPKDRYEIIVVDDSSSDSSPNLIMNIQKDVELPKIIWMRNKGNGVVDAYKTGIDASSGDILVRFTAHLVGEPDTIRTLVQYLLKYSKEVVGVTTAYKIYKSDSFFSKAVVSILTSRMGGWGTSHMNRKRVKTAIGSAVLAIYKKSLNLIGGYPQGDDSELYVLFKRKGLFVRYLLDQKVAYRYKHSGFFKHLKRMVIYGKIRARLTRKYPESFKIIHLAPTILVLLSILFFILNLSSNLMLSIYVVEFLLSSYFFLIIIQSILISFKQRTPMYLLLLPPLFYLTHISYGLGFLRGLLGNDYTPSEYR